MPSFGTVAETGNNGNEIPGLSKTVGAVEGFSGSGLKGVPACIDGV